MNASVCSPTVALSQPRRKCDSPNWDAYKDIISKLYSTSELKQVMKIMHETYDFKATTKQYKNQITKWRLDKKRIKGAEYKAILKEKWRHEKQEPTARIRIFLRGKEVPASKISRYESRMRLQKKIIGDETFPEVSTPRDLEVKIALPPNPNDCINGVVADISNTPPNALTIRTVPTPKAQTGTFDPRSIPLAGPGSAMSVCAYCSNDLMGTNLLCISPPDPPCSFARSTLHQLHFIRSPSLIACGWWALYSEYCSMPCEAIYHTPPRHPLEMILRSYARKVHSYDDHFRHSEILKIFGRCDAGCCSNIEPRPLLSSACTLHRVRNKLQKDWRDGNLTIEVYLKLQAHTFFRILPQLEVSHHALVKYAMTALASIGNFQAYMVLYDFLQKFISPSSFPYRCALLNIASNLHKVGRDVQATDCLRSALSDAYQTIVSICDKSYSECTSLSQATAALTNGRVELSYDHIGMLWYYPVGEYASQEIKAWYFLEDGRLDSGELWIHACALQIMCNMRRILDEKYCKTKTGYPVRLATCNAVVA